MLCLYEKNETHFKYDNPLKELDIFILESDITIYHMTSLCKNVNYLGENATSLFKTVKLSL